MPARLLSAVGCLLAAGLVVDLFFPWTEGAGGEFDIGSTTGLDSGPGFFSFAIGSGLVLWELLGVLGVQRTLRSDALVAYFLAAGTGVAAISAVVHLKWGAPTPFSNDLTAAALLAVPLSILLIAVAVAHLRLHVVASRPVAAP